MTKSTITRERLEQLADNNTICKVSWDERIELARMALAAMDSSESVELPLDYLQGHKDALEWAAKLAEANHPETGDWLYDDPIELAKAIRKGPDMPPVQPVADSEPVAYMWDSKRNDIDAPGFYFPEHLFFAESNVKQWGGEVIPLYRHAQPAPEYPEVLPCSVLLEPGLRFGKGIKTSTMLAALARRAVYESDMAALSPEEKAEFQARIDGFKALIAQPAPVVPENCVTVEHRRVIEMLLNVCGAAFELADDSCQQDVDGEDCHVVPDDAFQKLSDALDEIENTLPTEDIDRPDVFLAWSAMPRAALKSLLQAGKSPAIPDGYVMVPKEPTDEMIAAAMNCEDVLFNSDDSFCVQFGNIYEAMLAAAQQSPGSEPATVPGKWIPVSERMPPRTPDTSVEYLVYETLNDSVQHDYWNVPERNRSCQAFWNHYGDAVTHWQSLPEPPQETKP